MKFFADRLNAISFKIKRALGIRSDVDMVIGEVLKEHNIITEDQLQTALEVQKDKLFQLGQVVRLGLIIAELGYATEDEIVQAVNQHYRLSAASLSDNIKERISKIRGTFVERLPAPRIPIWLQLSITTILVILLTTFVLSFVILDRQKNRLYQYKVEIARVSLNYFADNSRINLLQDNILQLNTLIRNAAAVEGLLYAVIVDNQQIVKAHTDQNKIGMPFELPTDKNVLDLTRPVLFKDKQLGEVHVGVSIDKINQLIHKETYSVILISLSIILFGIVIAILLGFRFSRPISKLVLATQEIGKGNYHHKVELARNDELGNLATAFNQMSEELWKNSLMQKSFGKYVGPEVLEMIMANPEKTWLKGHRNDATIFFADIRGFTHYSGEKEPERVVEQLNEYFEIATKTIIKHGGYIDKFIGDAVLGVFGVPVYRKDHVERAVRAAVYLQKEVSKADKTDNKLFGSIGIGIDSGVVVSGNIGSQVKMEYTVIGDSVNLASRLNQLAGPGEIIISSTVYKQLGDMIAVEALPPRRIKGKSEPIEIFKVLSIKERGNVYIEE